MHLNFIKHSQTSCIYLTFLQCGFLNVSSNSNWSIKLFADYGSVFLNWECFPEFWHFCRLIGLFPQILVIIRLEKQEDNSSSAPEKWKGCIINILKVYWHVLCRRDFAATPEGLSKLSNSTNIVINFSTICQAEQNDWQIVRWQCCQLKTV